MVDDNSLAHAQHAIDLLDSQPMEDIRHQSLEAHVLHASNVLGTLEVFGCAVQTTLSSVVDEVLRHAVS